MIIVPIEDIPMHDNGLLYRPSTLDQGDGAAETFRLGHLLACYKHFFNEEPIRYIGPDGPEHFDFNYPKAYETLKTTGAGRFANPGDTPDRFSGDQHIPMIMFFGAMGSAALALPESDWRFQNGDLIWPGREHVITRALGYTPSRFYDQFIWPTVYTRCGYLPFYDSGIKKWKLGDPDDVADVLNLFHTFLQCEYIGHTKTSEAAQRLFFNNITRSYRWPHDEEILGHPDFKRDTSPDLDHPVIRAVRWYYKGDDWGIVNLYAGLMRVFT